MLGMIDLEPRQSGAFQTAQDVLFRLARKLKPDRMCDYGNASGLTHNLDRVLSGDTLPFHKTGRVFADETLKRVFVVCGIALFDENPRKMRTASQASAARLDFGERDVNSSIPE